MQYGVYTILAPMLFLATWKHSFGTCSDASTRLVPEDYINVQVETILNGLCVRPPPASSPSQNPQRKLAS
jgi:TetR/AcrR family transcriptional regulator